MSLADLTPRQEQVFDFICSQIQSRGIAPSMREICEHFGFSSTNAAEVHLTALEKKGVINRDAKTARGITIAWKGIPYFDSPAQLAQLLQD